MPDRRQFLKVAGAASLVPLLSRCRREQREPEAKWARGAYVKPARSQVAIVRAAVYDDRLEQTVVEGLALFKLDVTGRRVVLKPNLVEFDPRGVINTHPALVAATARAFKRLGAREVVVAEGPGHRRDNQYLLSASGLRTALKDVRAPYVDLNNDSVTRVRLRSQYTGLGELYLPDTVTRADLLVSMPKLKTHHWAGATLSMKNMFGVVPGMIYGWPKNILHQKGIPNSIIDINANLGVPRFNIVDGIVGMEGNGPIQGTAKQSGLLAFGADPVAVDATCARLMTLEPWKIGYLREADRFFGNVADDRIDLVAESIESLRQDYRVIDGFRGLKETSLARGV
jgi:uncharacterized protein (DUF362 family)